MVYEKLAVVRRPPQTAQNLGPVHTNPFTNENGAVFCSVFKKICIHTYRFCIVFALPHYNAVSVLKTLLYPQCAC